MSGAREVQSYEYVNQPYERVRDAVTADPVALFGSATRAATSRVRSLAAELRVGVAGVQMAAEIEITVDRIEEVERGPVVGPATRLHLEWEAARLPRLFPLMEGVLAVYGLTSTETQIDFHGRYDPPLGPLGDTLDAVALRRVAEASVHRFVQDVAHELRDRLAEE